MPRYVQNSILTVSKDEKLTAHLSAMLPPSLYTVHAAANCGEARRALMRTDFDILIINTPLSDEFGVELALDRVQKSTGGVILLVAADRFADVAAKVEGYGVLPVEKPVSRALLSTVLKLCAATRSRMRALEKKTETLAAKMDEIRVVNRAKWALIQVLGMNEEQAHRYIEKQAMDLRLTKREVAENIIRTYED